MLEVNDPYSRNVAACLLDFFGTRAPWQRRLWAVGTVLGLREVCEGCEAVQSGVFSPRSFADLCETVVISLGQDPGAGEPEERKILQTSLRALGKMEGARVGGVEYFVIEQSVRRIDDLYFERWRQTLRQPGSRPNFDRAARWIAAHLLDAGFSDSYLHRWWTYRIHHEPGSRSLADLVGDAHDLLRSDPPRFEVLVPFEGAPGLGAPAPANWRASTEVSAWLYENGFDSRELRQGGGLLLDLKARDVYAAVERISEDVERLSARVDLGTRSNLKSVGQVWVRGQSSPFPLRRTSRGVEVRALARENQLYNGSATSNVDAALELIGPLNEGPPGPAVAGGWAALEALLLGPGDGRGRSVAADRLAALVACSFPRAELTTLAYSHSKHGDDELSAKLAAAASNRDRASLVAQAITTARALALDSESDRLAESRLQRLLSQPKVGLQDIEQHACKTLRRFYRQRNLVLHWGRMSAVCLRSALRTAAPLIGAGIDRIAHAWFTEGTSPLELSARARLRLELVGIAARVSAVELLEP